MRARVEFVCVCMFVRGRSARLGVFGVHDESTLVTLLATLAGLPCAACSLAVPATTATATPPHSCLYVSTLLHLHFASAF